VKSKITPQGEGAWIKNIPEAIERVRKGGYAYQVGINKLNSGMNELTSEMNK